MREFILDRVLCGSELFREPSLVVAYAAMDLALCDRLDDAERLCSAVIEAGQQRGSPSLVATFAFPRAFARLRRGRLRDAEADARWSYEQKLAMDAEHGPPWPLAFLLDIGGFENQQSRAAARAFGVVFDEIVADEAVLVRKLRAGRREHNPVRQLQRADPAGGEQFWKCRVRHPVS